MEVWVQRHFGVTVVLLWTYCRHYDIINTNSLLGVCYQRRASTTQQICLTVHSQSMYDLQFYTYYLYFWCLKIEKVVAYVV